MPVLVLDGHSRAAIETVQSLGRAGLEVDVGSERADALALFSRYATLRLCQPSPSSPAEFESWLRAADADRNYELIVPSTEAALLALRDIEETDRVRRKAVLPGNPALDVALDKQRTCRLARQLDVPAPGSVLVSSLDDVDRPGAFPVVLKPVRSKVIVDGQLRALAVAIVTNEAQRREQLQEWLRFTPVLQQAYVFGRGMGAEFLFDRGKKVWHFAHERLHEFPLSGGASSYRRSVEPPPRLLADAERLLTALRWHGVAMVEFKLDREGQHWLLEINPRLWGSLALAIDAGVDFPLGLLRLARGEANPVQPLYRKHYYTRDLRTDIEWFKGNLHPRSNDLLLHTRPRLRAALELLRPLAGIESWDHFDWHDLGTTRRILARTLGHQLRPAVRKLYGWRQKRKLLRHHGLLLRKLAALGGPRKIVFLCSGNICRSPLAARLTQAGLRGIEVFSAGFHHTLGRTCPAAILRMAREFGCDLSAHRSGRVSKELLANTHLIIAMDLDNISRLESEFPDVLPRTTLLGFFAQPARTVIEDPYRLGEDDARQICNAVRLGVEGLMVFLQACAQKPPAGQTGRRQQPPPLLDCERA